MQRHGTISYGEDLNLAYRELIKQRLSLLIFQLSGGTISGQISRFVKFYKRFKNFNHTRYRQTL